ncbi:hypothetical protein C0995_008106 [Termitomyces sp. Mi166|nr:hypothetical protein C0995_008106 [Termitomyces sp. Mi166\
MKACQVVRVSRLELDAAKQTLKNGGPAKQEHARLEVENAEDDLVQKTEVAITLMKTVLKNPEPIKNLNELAKAQLLLFSTVVEALSTIQGEIEELTVADEGEYRMIMIRGPELQVLFIINTFPELCPTLNCNPSASPPPHPYGNTLNKNVESSERCMGNFWGVLRNCRGRI